MTNPLPPNQLESLLPALRHVAELVQKSGAPNRENLQLLLIASGLEEEWAIDELSRWAKVLVMVRSVTDTGKREVAVRGLMLRGILEAPAKLAVETAAGTASVPPRFHSEPKAATSLPIQVSREALGFGELKPGQGTQETFTVSGGPGQVKIGSDVVTVEPETFGPNETTLTVIVKAGVDGQVLWDALTLESETENVNVDLTARWTTLPVSEEPVALEHQVKIPMAISDHLVVAPDGSGTHRTLAEALADAGSGATIYLRGGTHYLGQGLLLRQAVTLIGERGNGSTELVAEQGDYVLRYEGDGLFCLRDLAARWMGTGLADVVTVRNGEVQIEHCRFSGATVGENLYGGGLELKGNVRGKVMSCQMQGNGTGIIVGEQAQPTLENNTCQRNKASGIAYFDDAAGTAKKNTCTDNEKRGIYVGEQAQPTLEDNTCQRNEENGIGVCEQASPSLEGNRCQQNKLGGISFWGSATGTAKKNICTSNEKSGIYVGEQAQPALENNTCQRNKGTGIAYSGNATGTAKNNICTGNEKFGIIVGEQARPTLENNTCQRNKLVGIVYSGSAGGTAKNNTCTDSEKAGIAVVKQAQPTLEGNICWRIKQTGIAYSGNAAGTAKNNTCTGNEEDGIYVSSTANPRLENNRCFGNRGRDINDRR